MEFIVGDVVYINTNPNVLMTVFLIVGSSSVQDLEIHRKMGFTDGDVLCIWFDGKNFASNIFKNNMVSLKSRSTTRPLFNIGDRVSLKSNPETIMTVSNVVGASKEEDKEDFHEMGFTDGDVQCTWSTGSNFKILFLYAAMLEKKGSMPFSGKKIIQFPSHLSVKSKS